MSVVRPVGRLWLARQWRVFVPVTVTIAVCFAVAFLALAGSRRTQSAYPRFLDHVRSSTVSVSTAGAYTESTNRSIATIPGVQSSRTYIGISLYVLVGGQPDFSHVFEGTGTNDGRYFDQDRFTATRGRMADPGRNDEVVVNEFGAKQFGYRVGQQLDLAPYRTEQIIDPAFFSQPPEPETHQLATIVGIGAFPDEILQDDADRTARLLVTPAFSRPLESYWSYGLQGVVLDGGDAAVPLFLDRLAAIVPLGDVELRLTSVDRTNALAAMRPLSLVLAAFGALAALAGTLLSCQAVSRSLRQSHEERRLLVVFGASSSQVLAVSLVTIAAAVVSGVALAALAAVVASPAMPIGPVRRVEAAPGVDVDLTVLLLGSALATGVLLAWGAWVVWREITTTSVRSATSVAPSGRLARLLGGRLPPAPAAGARFALGGRHHVAARSAVVSAVAASAAILAAVTFAASLSRLVRTPAMFGWDYDAAVVSGNGYDNLDEDRVRTVLGGDPAIASWSAVYFGASAVRNVDVPLLGLRPDAVVRPPLVGGRFVHDDNEIVLGQDTARALGVSIGDVVTFDGSVHPLRVVGLAVLPTLGRTHAQHTSLGHGAVVVPSLVPGVDLDILGDHHVEPLGPNALFVRYRRDVDPAAALAHLRDTMAPFRRFAGLDVLAAQRPAEMVSSDDVRAAPVLLAAGLALAAIVSLLIALTTSGRMHGRELAVLAALGFTRRQRAATLMWHAVVVVAIGLLIGVPVGALAGRSSWRTFARRIDVLAPAVAPWRSGAFVTLGGVLLALAVGVGPARAAGRSNVAATLRSQ